MLDVVNAFLANDSTLILVSRENGRRVLRSVPAEWVAYFRAKDLNAELVRELKFSAAVRGLRQEGEWVRVAFVNRVAREFICNDRHSFVSQFGIEAYEADVHPGLRHVVDAGLHVAKPRRVYLDLETDSRLSFSKKEEMRILSWAIVDEDERAQVGILEEDADRAERKLLMDLWRALEPYDQVVAWNGDEFDFPVLFARSEDRGCDINSNHWLWLDHMVLFRRMNLNASESGEEKESMRLNDIAQAVVGEGKEVTPPEVIAKFGDQALGALSWPLWEAGGEWRSLHARYNLKDTDLLRRIEHETGYIGVFDALAEACGVFADSSGLNPTHQMDGFMFRLGKERGRHFPTKKYREKIEKFKGAFVMHPRSVAGEKKDWTEDDARLWRTRMGLKNGILRNVHVGDFKSLYPSIILTWNMSPESKRFSDDDIDLAVSPLTGIKFDPEVDALLPTALRELIRLRKVWSDKKSQCAPGTPEWHDANRKSTAYKVAANSFYGVVGSPFSRFFDRQIAESITQNGVWLIQETIKLAEANEMQAVYGDTDSVFVTGATEDEFRHFVEHCNVELYPPLLTDQGCKENHIKLAYEKAFERIVFVSAKRYAGRYLHADGKRATENSKPEIKGLEYKRGDAASLARQLQAQVIDLICGGLKLNPDVQTPTEDLQHYVDIVSRMQHHALAEPLTLAEVRLSQSLGKPLKEYAEKFKKDGTAAAQPPHVVVAKLLKGRGEAVDEGTRIEYVVIDGSSSPMKVVPASDYIGPSGELLGDEIDRHYLWESRIFPPTLRLLEAAFPDTDWESFRSTRPKKPRGSRKKSVPATAQLTA